MDCRSDKVYAIAARTVVFSWQVRWDAVPIRLSWVGRSPGSVKLGWLSRIRDIYLNVGGSGGSPPTAAQVSGWVGVVKLSSISCRTRLACSHL